MTSLETMTHRKFTPLKKDTEYYFTPGIFKKILDYCNDTVKQKRDRLWKTITVRRFEYPDDKKKNLARTICWTAELAGVDWFQLINTTSHSLSFLSFEKWKQKQILDDMERNPGNLAIPPGLIIQLVKAVYYGY